MRQGAAFCLEQLLDEVVTDFLGREHYHRAKAEENKSGYRNGYEPRKVKTTDERWRSTSLK